MTIAIYGDSYANWTCWSNQTSSDILARAWSRQLEQHAPVVNFSRGGAGIWHNLNLLERDPDHADQVIFIASPIGRWPGVIEHPDWQHDSDRYQPSANHCQETLSRWQDRLAQYPSQIQQVCSVEAWYRLAQVPSFEQYVYALALERVLELRPDAIIIPMQAWPNLGLSAKTDQIGTRVACIDYVVRAWRGWLNDLTLTAGNYYSLYQQYREHRVVCHLTPELNDRFLADVLDALATGTWNPNLPDQIYHDNPLDYYYQRL